LTDQPEPGGSRRPGRRPHVPSSKPTMSKSRRASSPGSIGSGHRLYRPRRGANERETSKRPRPLAEGAYMGGPPMRQPAFLQVCCSLPVNAGRDAVSGAPRLITRWGLCPLYSRWRLTRISNVFRRFECSCASPRPRPRSAPCGASPGRRSRRCRGSGAIRPRAGGESGAGSSAPAPRVPRSRGRR
jgi:hypothetical protein